MVQVGDLKRVHGIDVVACLGESWDRLLSRSVSNVLFLRRSFQTVWWATLGESEPLVITSGDDNDEPWLIAPFYLATTPGGERAVRFIGGTEVADYLDLLVAPADAARGWGLVFDHLASMAAQWDLLDFYALPDWSPSRALILAEATRRGWQAIEAKDDVCPAIALPPTWDDYLKGLTKKDRHEMRRKIGRLERAEIGERFTMVTGGSEAEIAAATAEFFRLHRLSGHDKDGFWTPALERFFVQLIAQAGADGTLRLALQSVGERAAACVLSFRYGDRYYVYNSGYDPELREYAAGVVCMARAIATAIDEGVAWFDLLQGDEKYKYDFGARDGLVHRVTVRR